MHKPQTLFASLLRLYAYAKDDRKYFVPMFVSIILLASASLFLFPAGSDKSRQGIASFGIDLLSMFISLAQSVILLALLLRSASWISRTQNKTASTTKGILSYLLSELGIVLCIGLTYYVIPVIVYYIVTAGMSPSERASYLSRFIAHYSGIISFFYMFSIPILIFNGKTGFRNVISSFVISINEPLLVSALAIPVYLGNIMRIYLFSPGVTQNIFKLASMTIGYILNMLALFVYSIIMPTIVAGIQEKNQFNSSTSQDENQ